MQEIEERTYQIIAEQLGIAEEEITSTLSFKKDLGADSLDLLELILAMEEEFEIEISDAEAEQIDTVQTLLNYLNERVYK